MRRLSARSFPLSLPTRCHPWPCITLNPSRTCQCVSAHPALLFLPLFLLLIRCLCCFARPRSTTCSDGGIARRPWLRPSRRIEIGTSAHHREVSTTGTVSPRPSTATSTNTTRSTRLSSSSGRLSRLSSAHGSRRSKGLISEINLDSICKALQSHFFSHLI